MPCFETFFPEIEKWSQRTLSAPVQENFPSPSLPPLDYDNQITRYFEVEGITYPLEKDILFLVANLSEGYRYICPDFSNWFSGKGKTEVEAIEDWKREFHENFQAIRGLMYYELTDDQRELRKHFTEYISKKNYNDHNPLKGIETGKIIDICEQSNRTEFLVEWINTFQERVSQKYFSGKTKSLQRGVWFEAEIKRNYYSNRIIEVNLIRIIENLDEPSDNFDAF